MKILVVYVAQESRENLDHGLGKGVWGFTDKAKPDQFEEVKAGDVIVFGSGYTGGAPRTEFELWQKNSIRKLLYATISSECFESTQPEWRNEAAMPENERYKWRIRFDPQSVHSLENVALNDSSILSPKLSDYIRKSGCVQGQTIITNCKSIGSSGIPISIRE